MNTYCTASGTLLQALWWLKWEKRKWEERGDMFIGIANPLCYTMKATQHCKATVLQEK